mgnify:CR=1 FL=1
MGDLGGKDKTVFDLYSGTGTIAQLMAPVSGKVIGVEIVEEAVEAAVNALNAVVEDIKKNDANTCTFAITSLDLSQWTNLSPLAMAEITDAGIVITPDVNDSTVFTFNNALTGKQTMKYNFKYETVGDYLAVCTRQVTKGTTPTWSRGYFFVIKDDLIEFQKYTAKSKGEIVAMVPNNGQIKSGETYEFEVGAVNVDGGVLNTLKVNGNVVLEYLDTENPIYDQGYFSIYLHKTLGGGTLSPIK